MMTEESRLSASSEVTVMTVGLEGNRRTAAR